MHLFPSPPLPPSILSAPVCRDIHNESEVPQPICVNNKAQWRDTVLTPVVQSPNNAIQRIDRYPADKRQRSALCFASDRDLSNGYRYPPFDQPRSARLPWGHHFFPVDTWMKKSFLTLFQNWVLVKWMCCGIVWCVIQRVPMIHWSGFCNKHKVKSFMLWMFLLCSTF